jgi:superfamily II DNA or RNA helicase/HKD family nuclease
MTLPKGLYDRLVYEDEVGEITRLAEQHRALVAAPTVHQRREQFIAELVHRLPELLDAVAAGQHDAITKARAELELIRQLLIQLRPPGQDDRSLAMPPQLLKSIHAPNSNLVMPATGLRHPWLFTSARADPSLLNELRAELLAVDRVDILVSFITWSGVRKLLDVFEQVTALDANGNPKTKFRILTTTYIGATEVRAVDALAKLPGVELRISLDGRRTRLHAKAWIFHRDTNFGTAFVGSANLSESALIGGIEWTVKFAQSSGTSLFSAAVANFETLWNDREFQPYDPANDQHREALTRSLARERGHNGRQPAPNGAVVALQTWFDLRPKSYQQEMLDQLNSERRLGRRRNLVVAATGTGKTVVAAFDYLRLREEEGAAPKLLFIAHRSQILAQALSTFRQVLRDPAFGELMDGDNTPSHYEHIFATINTVHSRRLVEQIGPHFWRMVIVDEAHHLPAATFDQFIGAVQPHYLLGLTATPERSDGQSLTQYFDSRPDGSPAVSLRLWDALDQQLLTPFEYYATADDTDMTTVEWGRGAEVAQLSNIVSGNSVRARTVVNAVATYVADLDALKGLAFCVSVSHAVFMADFFNRSGLPAVALSGADSQEARTAAVQQLSSGTLKIICSCDVFNEGVDIPDANAILLLRPTQSPVIFQQQIGRGLRLARGKSACLVLDFVGLYNNEFRFDVLLRSITGTSRRQITDAVVNGFSTLPAGVHIQFDRVARARVLANLQEALNLNVLRLGAELAAWASLQNGRPLLLRDFLLDCHLELSDVYTEGSNARSWTSLKRRVSLEQRTEGQREADIARRIFSVLHADDPKLLTAWCEALAGGEVDARRVQMLAYQLLPSRTELVTPADFLSLLADNPVVQAELRELVPILRERSSLAPNPLPGAPNHWTLALHARYKRAEILAAVGLATAIARPRSDSGCEPLPDIKTEILFVTLDKSEGFAERVQFKDYAISPELFHWQSQNRAGPNNNTGRRYTESHSNGWKFQLFVREDRDAAYVAVGPVHLVSHEGDRPISITWRLEQPLTAELFRKFSVLRG